MSNVKKYEQILEKYNLDSLKEDYLHRFEDLDKPKKSVGIWGERQGVIQVLADIFDLQELKGIFPSDYCIRLRYGESKTYQVIEKGIEAECSFDEFCEKMQDTGGLEDIDHVFEGVIALPVEILNSLKITAYALPVDGSNSFMDFLFNDICAVVLSATHLLSLDERKLIGNPLNTSKCYFLCDIDKVHEDEREHVRSLIDQYTSNGEKCYMIPYLEDKHIIIDDWINTSGIVENRTRKIDIYFKPLIVAAINEKLSAVSHENELINQIVANLESAKNKLPEYKDKTVRYININYIEGIKTDTISEVVNFYEKLNDDITAGIREEKNVKELQKELPNFIAKAWVEFVEQDLNAQVQAKVDMVVPAIEEYVDQKTELFLKEILSDEEFKYINSAVVNAIDSVNVSQNRPGTVSGNTSLNKQDSITLRNILPKCLIALGGMAVLSSSFVLGALLVVAGVNTNKEAINETQNELIEAGKKLNYDYLKEVKSNLEELMNRIKDSTEMTVERCYTNVIDTLIQLIQSYKNKTKEFDEIMTLINADMEAL